MGDCGWEAGGGWARSDACSMSNGPRRPWPSALPEGEVHVWRFSLDAAPAALPDFVAVLSAEERARAARFRFSVDRERYIVAHAKLRAILGGYLGLDAAAVRLRSGRHGKPELDSEERSRLRFNLAHSGNIGLCAVAWDREVGVDVEREDAGRDYPRVAERCFSPEEVERLRRLDGDQARAAFLRLWTRQEALLKAQGLGLPGLRAVHQEVASDWTVRDLAVDAGYVAALAVAGDLAVVCLHMD